VEKAGLAPAFLLCAAPICYGILWLRNAHFSPRMWFLGDSI